MLHQPSSLSSVGSFAMLLNLRRGEIILFEVAPLNQIRNHSSRGALELKCTNKTQSNHSLTKGRSRGRGEICSLYYEARRKIHLKFYKPSIF